jgi:hypothetical protein
MNEKKLAALGQKAASKDSTDTIATYRQLSSGIADYIRAGGGK